jgi:two-component system response regulator YesN
MINVILADDEDWTRDIIKRFGAWDVYGMEVIGEAENGAEAIRLIETLSPQLVITDMRMPGVDGVELMAAVNERFPDIRMIVISGYDDFAYAKHALRYGALDYILKPVDAKELNEALAKCRTELESPAAEPMIIDLESAIHVTTHKEMIRSQFRDMNAERLGNQFDRLGAELEEKRPSKQELQRMAGEFLMFLKELMEENSLEVDALRLIIVPDSVSTGAQLTDFLKGLFEKALESLLQQRKFKSKLNLDEVRHYLDSRFREPISLEELAKRFFVSKEYLSKAFKTEYGRNVTDYLLHLRMDKAREWLMNEEIPIKSIAEMAGYEDVSYFYRLFKKHYGLAPGEMRESKRGLKSSNPTD